MLSSTASPLFDLQPFHTFGLPCMANQLFFIRETADLLAYSRAVLAGGERVVLLGEGSNTVFVSSRLAGSVWKMAMLGKQYLGVVDGCHRVRVMAGENWHNVVEWTVAQGWSGLENLALIPGAVGAAPVQNIGAYGVELKDRVCEVHVFDAHTQGDEVWSVAACEFAYRDSVFKRAEAGRYVITAVVFALPVVWSPVLSYGDVETRARACVPVGGRLSAAHVLRAVCEIRSEKLPDPVVLGNSGSFFKNPVVPQRVFDAIRVRFPDAPGFSAGTGCVKLAAGWLIDRCGLKGFCLGGVGVYEKQALVLVNHGLGCGADLLALIELVQTKVQAQFGVMLEAEPCLV